jgi:hypothetical protein
MRGLGMASIILGIITLIASFILLQQIKIWGRTFRCWGRRRACRPKAIRYVYEDALNEICQWNLCAWRWSPKFGQYVKL